MTLVKPLRSSANMLSTFLTRFTRGLERLTKWHWRRRRWNGFSKSAGPSSRRTQPSGWTRSALPATTRRRILVLLTIAVAMVASAVGCSPSDREEDTLVVYGYSGMEEVLTGEVIPAFKLHWKRTTGRGLRVNTSFAGSGTITNQIAFGAPRRWRSWQPGWTRRIWRRPA